MNKMSDLSNIVGGACDGLMNGIDPLGRGYDRLTKGKATQERGLVPYSDTKSVLYRVSKGVGAVAGGAANYVSYGVPQGLALLVRYLGRKKK